MVAFLAESSRSEAQTAVRLRYYRQNPEDVNMLFLDDDQMCAQLTTAELNEASLSRIFSHMGSQPFAIVSAQRGDRITVSKDATPAEKEQAAIANTAANNQMRQWAASEIRSIFKKSFIKVMGAYREKGAPDVDREYSFFLPNVSREEALKLARHFTSHKTSGDPDNIFWGTPDKEGFWVYGDGRFKKIGDRITTSNMPKYYTEWRWRKNRSAVNKRAGARFTSVGRLGITDIRARGESEYVARIRYIPESIHEFKSWIMELDSVIETRGADTQYATRFRDDAGELTIKAGDYIRWRTLAGDPHYGPIKQMDGNVAVIDCEVHHKDCPCEC
ncbi:hypothetical protein HS125_17175 [bacterium]|nr:hypothetical protein [bacterium]